MEHRLNPVEDNSGSESWDSRRGVGRENTECAMADWVDPLGEDLSERDPGTGQAA